MPNIGIPSFDDFPKSTTFCLICGKEIVEIGFIDPRIAKVCDDCKTAIEWVKKHMDCEGR